MICILIIWTTIIFIEIFRNWCIIEVGKKRPTYWWSNCIRVAVGFLFWVVSKLFIVITYQQWWLMIPLMLSSFWWMFDYGLTAFRNVMNRLQKNGHAPILFCYLNSQGSWLDQKQSKYLGWAWWFYLKLGLMIGFTYLFFTL